MSAAQMIGGIVAAALVSALTPGSLDTIVALGNGTTMAQGLFIEMFGTAALVLSVLMLAAGEARDIVQADRQKSTSSPSWLH